MNKLMILFLSLSVSVFTDGIVAEAKGHPRRLPGSRYPVEKHIARQSSFVNDIALTGRPADPPLDSNVIIMEFNQITTLLFSYIIF